MPDLVAIDMPGGPAFVDTLRRAWDRGAAVLPVDQRLSRSVKASLLEEMRPNLLAGAEGVTELPGGVPVEDGDALVVATSGTTGRPKGVILTRGAVEASAFATSSRLGIDPPRHRWVACLPLNHVGGLSVVTRSVLTGTPLVVLPGFDVDLVREASGADTFVALVATALLRIGAEAFHTVLLGGSAQPPNLPPNVVTTYGLTETGSGVVYDGVALDGVDVDVVSDTSEIRLRGPMLMRAYRDGSDPFDPGGWLPTGDCGRIGPNGRLEVLGRIGDMIVTGGENVWPGPVEDVLKRLAGVAEVAVAGVADPEWGQRVVAWIVPLEPSSPPLLSDLRRGVAEHIAPFAAPRQMVLVRSLPRTSIGKVRRQELTVPDSQPSPD